MVEYGGAVSVGSGAVGGGAGSADVGGNVMEALSDVVDRVTSLPPEILLLLLAALLIGGLVFRRA